VCGVFGGGRGRLSSFGGVGGYGFLVLFLSQGLLFLVVVEVLNPFPFSRGLSVGGVLVFF
jgi:hypothetical protein